MGSGDLDILVGSGDSVIFGGSRFWVFWLVLYLGIFVGSGNPGILVSSGDPGI